MDAGPGRANLRAAATPANGRVAANGASNGVGPGVPCLEVAHPLQADLIDLMVERLSAMADPVRVRVLDRLRSGWLSVAEIAETQPTSQQNVSKHLARLHRAGLVDRRREGTSVRYGISSPTVLRLLDVVAREVLQEVDALARRLHGVDGEL
jgi:DNA-binding transcriptional ArsR family regulator